MVLLSFCESANAMRVAIHGEDTDIHQRRSSRTNPLPKESSQDSDDASEDPPSSPDFSEVHEAFSNFKAEVETYLHMAIATWLTSDSVLQHALLTAQEAASEVDQATGKCVGQKQTSRRMGLESSLSALITEVSIQEQDVTDASRWFRRWQNASYGLADDWPSHAQVALASFHCCFGLIQSSLDEWLSQNSCFFPKAEDWTLTEDLWEALDEQVQAQANSAQGILRRSHRVNLAPAALVQAAALRDRQTR